MAADLSERPKDLPAQQAQLAPRRYHVALPPAEVIERLRDQAGVKTRARGSLPELGPDDAQYTLELGNSEFSIRCNPQAVRGQSAIGMVRLSYLRGRLTETRDGTLVELSFASRRPQWAMQRWIGFLAVAGLGLAWVLIGPGVLAQKAMLYGALMLVLAPVIIHDLRRTDETEEQRRALLNLVEHAFGPVQLDEASKDEPYRRRSLAAPAEGRDDDQDDADDDPDTDNGSIAPENT
jgi:hypothetical protein